METTVKNIWVYKIVFADRKIAFEYKERDGIEGFMVTNIEALAMQVRHKVNLYLEIDHITQVSIDLTPFHDIECQTNRDPNLCVALSPEEKQKFWEYYNSP